MDSTVTTATLYSNLTSIFEAIMTAVGNVITTITSTPLFYVPVLLCLAAGVASIAVKIVRKFGLNGIGRRRKRRAR